MVSSVSTPSSTEKSIKSLSFLNNSPGRRRNFKKLGKDLGNGLTVGTPPVNFSLSSIDVHSLSIRSMLSNSMSSLPTLATIKGNDSMWLSASKRFMNSSIGSLVDVFEGPEDEVEARSSEILEELSPQFVIEDESHITHCVNRWSSGSNHGDDKILQRRNSSVDE